VPTGMVMYVSCGPVDFIASRVVCTWK